MAKNIVRSRRPVIIANWKINLSLGEREELAKELRRQLTNLANKDVVICPSAVSLASIGAIIGGSDLQLGAQDVFWEETGAYTGEISPLILRELDCRYAIVGHSERRQYLNETDAMINKKIAACLDNGLTPIFCVGETYGQRQENQTDNVLLAQLRRGLRDIDLVGGEQLVIAYEPVWAIGSGQPVEPAEAARVFNLIKQFLIDTYPLTIATNNVRLVYGGSVTAANVASFAKLKMLDGFLVGGASLAVGEFKKIVDSL